MLVTASYFQISQYLQTRLELIQVETLMVGSYSCLHIVDYVTDTLAYYGSYLIMAVKSFIGEARGVNM